MARRSTPPPSAPFTPLRRRSERRTRRRVQLALLFVSLVLIAEALIGERGVLATYRARQEGKALLAHIEALKAENAELSERARLLREDAATIEGVARRELGLIRPGEMLVLVNPHRNDGPDR